MDLGWVTDKYKKSAYTINDLSRELVIPFILTNLDLAVFSTFFQKYSQVGFILIFLPESGQASSLTSAFSKNVTEIV